jgi:hypothetical protein
MGEFKVHVPKSLEGEEKAIEIKVGGVISLEEKKKLLSDFIDETMKGAKQLNDKELVKMGRELKRSRAQVAQ